MIAGMRQGLTAAPGWDAVTGFGSINFERMLRYVLPGSDAVSISSLTKDVAMAANASAVAVAAAASAASMAASLAEVKKEAENSKSFAGKDSFPPLFLPFYFLQVANVTHFFISRGHRPIMHSVGFEHFSVLEGAGHPFCSLFPSISVLACMPDLALLLTCSCAPYFWTDARAGLATECSCRNQRINVARETKALI